MAVFSEGTAELLPDSTKICRLDIHTGGGEYSCFAMESCKADNRLYVHISKVGEVVYFGCDKSCTVKIKHNGNLDATLSISYPSGKGAIKYYKQAYVGPDVIDPHGYHAQKFVPTAPGDYSFNFTSELELDRYDFTVIDTTITPLVPIKGRLWSKDWSFIHGNITTTGQMHGTQFIYTEDSVVTSVYYNGMQGNAYDVTSTRNGCYPPPVPWSTSCRSIDGNHHYPQYKIFVNDPDSLSYPTGIPGVITPSPQFIQGECDGSFTMDFSVNKSGWVDVLIEVDPAPGLQPVDVEFMDSVEPGQNIFSWDGKDGMGNPVTCGDSVMINFTYINGLTNIALYDVERQIDGFIIELVRPSGPPIKTFWNDTLLNGSLQLDGCLPVLPNDGCHKWTGDYNIGLGDKNTVNSWWYASSSLLNAGTFAVTCTPYLPGGITGPLEHCPVGFVQYFSDPYPTPGADSCEWIITDSGGTIYLDTIAPGCQCFLNFSGIPEGPKLIKVRGINPKCGNGPYSNPFSVNIIPAPEITNAINSFSICSGDSVRIDITSTYTQSVITYTALSTSPNISGYSGGSGNLIRQKLINSGNKTDTVIYRVVPYLDPCYGDTFNFYAKVRPLSEEIIITTAADSVCPGKTVTVFADSSMASPVYTWKLNGVVTGSDSPRLQFIPANNDQIQCFVSSPDLCSASNATQSNILTFFLKTPLTVTASVSPVSNPVCSGTPITVNASGSNWGTDPSYLWKYSGIVIDTTLTISFVPQQSGRITFSVNSSVDCPLDPVATDSVQIIIADSIKTLDTIVCYGSSYYAGGQWQTTPGIYTDTIPSPADCFKYLQTDLSFKNEIAIDLGADTVICEEPVVLIPLIPATATCVWPDGSTGNSFTVNSPGSYWVVVTLEGCSGSDTLTVGACPVKIYFPSSFTPDGDGINDLFRPIGAGYEAFSMQIFDRWGKILFSTKSAETGWDGTSSGQPCPQGTYAFTATFKGLTGEDKVLTGTIHLIR